MVTVHLLKQPLRVTFQKMQEIVVIYGVDFPIPTIQSLEHLKCNYKNRLLYHFLCVYKLWYFNDIGKKHILTFNIKLIFRSLF